MEKPEGIEELLKEHEIKERRTTGGPVAPMEIMKNLRQYVWPSKMDCEGSDKTDASEIKLRVVASISLLVASKLATIEVPFLFKSIVDTLTENPNVGESIDLVGSAATAVPLGLVLGYGIGRASATIFSESKNAVFSLVAQKANRAILRKVFSHLLTLDMKYHVERQTGTVSRIMIRGSRSVTWILSALVFHVIPTALEVGIVSAILMWKFGPEYTAVAIGTLLAYLLYTIKITQWRSKYIRLKIQLENMASNRSMESLINYEMVKYFNKEGIETRRYDNALAGTLWAGVMQQTTLSVLNAGQGVILSMGLAAMMLLASNGVVSGNLTAGDLVLVNSLLFQLSIPLNMFGTVYRETAQSLLDMEAMFGLLQQQPKIKDGEASQEIDGTADIVFENVAFSYAKGRQILNGLTFTIKSGQKVAVVGASGSGKSTILKLLYRFYDPDSGSIKIGGVDIKDARLGSLREAVGVVPQDTILFNDTIRYNIGYGSRSPGMEVDDQVLERVARNAKIYDSIADMPDNFNSIVGERGLKLSGGEKQRVAIARAILKDSPILFCDEATSALDSTTETEIMHHIREIGKGKTTIMIAHRLSTVKDADKIIVLDSGKVVEEGTHDQLLADSESVYARMWHTQMSHKSPYDNAN